MDKKKAEQVIDSICKLSDTLVSSVKEEILELDELCSFVFCKKFKSWLWIALCRRTRQIVAFHLGNRSARSCKKLWDNVPENYKHSRPILIFGKLIKRLLKLKNIIVLEKILDKLIMSKDGIIP